MSQMVIAQRYVKALLRLAEKANKIEKVGEGLDAIADALATTPALQDFLAGTKASLKAKEETMGELMAKAGADDLAQTFVRFVTAKRRGLLLEAMRDAYHRMANEKLGIAEVDVTVASDLDGKQSQELSGKLETMTGKKVKLNVKVDPAILGGMVTKIGSTVRDGSLRHHLQTIRHSIVEG